MNLPPLQKAVSYITIKELSDPKSPIEYTGILLAGETSSIQNWSLVETADGDEMLFIDDQHQSSKSDEFRYHETFVHSLMAGLSNLPKKVLVLGGAEGCMLREILKWKSVEQIVQVDWDKSLVNYFKYNAKHWNEGAYFDPKVQVYCEEAIGWLEKSIETFDAIFVDLLDPFDTNLVFMKKLLDLCKNHLNSGGAISVNGGQIHDYPTTICKLASHMKDKFMNYNRSAIRVHVPSYRGIWCFLMASSDTSGLQQELPSDLKYFSKERLEHNILWDDKYTMEMQSYSNKDSIDLFRKVVEHHGC
jgi:spermidine synthase